MTSQPTNYTVEQTAIDATPVVTLRQSPTTFASITPTLGCNCFNLTINNRPVFQTAPFADYIKAPTSYGLPLLFPYPNRIPEGRFTFNNRDYHVHPSRHGYVRQNPWQLQRTSASPENGAQLTATFNANDFPDSILAQFPHPFHLELTLRLHNNALTLQLTAHNPGQTPMPAAFGIHPYFHIDPDSTIQLNANQRFELVDCLPTGNLIPVADHFDLRQPQPVSATNAPLDDIFTDLNLDSPSDPNQTVTATIHHPFAAARTLVSFSRTTFPHAVIFTPPAPRPALCIEPYTHPTNAFNLPESVAGNIAIPPGESHTYTIAFKLESD